MKVSAETKKIRPNFCPRCGTLHSVRIVGDDKIQRKHIIIDWETWEGLRDACIVSAAHCSSKSVAEEFEKIQRGAQ